jgi:hypothetical protein
MRAMGSKGAAKALMQKAGVPLLPGYHGAEQGADFLAGEAERIGFPLVIKAVAGGGGRGMRVVRGAEDFAEALQAARQEGLCLDASGSARGGLQRCHALRDRSLVRSHHDLRRRGRLVRIIDAGEALDLAGARLGVEALRVAGLRDGERRIDMHLEERDASLRMARADAIAIGAVRADHADDGDQERKDGTSNVMWGAADLAEESDVHRLGQRATGAQGCGGGLRHDEGHDAEEQRGQEGACRDGRLAGDKLPPLLAKEDAHLWIEEARDHGVSVLEASPSTWKKCLCCLPINRDI